MSGNFRMDDYIDVAQRIHDFYEEHPTGSLQSGCAPFVIEIGGKPFICYHALAYRTPDDQAPAHGWAWEPVPGPTQFTRDSELMNAETAAWGRAIVAAGFSTKKIASAQEVRARQVAPPVAAEGAAGAAHSPAAPANDGEYRLTFGKHKGMTLAQVPLNYVEWLRDKCENAQAKAAAVAFLGEADFAPVPYDEDIPFAPTLSPEGI